MKFTPLLSFLFLSIANAERDEVKWGHSRELRSSSYLSAFFRSIIRTGCSQYDCDSIRWETVLSFVIIVVLIVVLCAYCNKQGYEETDQEQGEKQGNDEEQ
jgi:putative component of membrane protein insertase Oxa1/YidC/SpoIIIJ protein YidD